MRRICLFFASVLVFLAAVAEKTPSVVLKYLDGIKRLSEISSVGDEFDLIRELKSCFRGISGGGSGIWMPQDFSVFGRTEDRLTAANYVGRIDQYVFKERTLTIDYEIVGTNYFAEPDLRNNAPGGYHETICKRRFNINNGESVNFTDTIRSRNGEITRYANRSQIGEDRETLEFLTDEATRLYASKNIRAAFHTYEKIMRLYPDDGNAYYRAGILAFRYYKECGLDRKSATKLAKNYMEEAVAREFPGAKKVLYYMTTGLRI